MQVISEEVFTIAHTLITDWLYDDYLNNFTNIHEMMISLNLLSSISDGNGRLVTRSVKQRLCVEMLIWDGIFRRQTLQLRENGCFYRTGMIELTERGKELFGFLLL